MISEKAIMSLTLEAVREMIVCRKSLVGAEGKVTGLDMTEPMVQKARRIT